MGIEGQLNAGALCAFLLVLARVSGAFIYVPLPGIQAGPEISRAILAIGLTLVLYPSWPVVDVAHITLPRLGGWMLTEAGIGLAVGLAAAFLAEGFQVGAQILSLQAGYSFATTIDPNSGADSGVLIAIANLLAGILFFATGLDREVLLSFARSLASQPPGHFDLSPSIASTLIHLGGAIFVTGLRLALPLLGLLLMIEISVALLARLNSQLQLMILTFPIKMLVSLALLASLVAVFPRMFTQSTGPVLDAIRAFLRS